MDTTAVPMVVAQTSTKTTDTNATCRARIPSGATDTALSALAAIPAAAHAGRRTTAAPVS
jgi:hypothetical protein